MVIVRYTQEGLDGHLKEFEDFLGIDQGLQPRTVSEHLRFVRAFHRSNLPLSKGGARAFLAWYNQNPTSKANAIKALRRYFRDFLCQGSVIEGFKIPKNQPSLLILPSKEWLGKFHDCLDLEHQVIFLVLASSGLRRGEVLSLTRRQVDLQKRILTPGIHSGQTKRNWYGFFNEEAKERLDEFLATRKDRKEKLSPPWMPGFKKVWVKASGRLRAKSPPRRSASGSRTRWQPWGSRTGS
ncbi:MAG: site-specific integrase [Candidatus Verstraetearchaeota archaeon]|nr:site-specific integrase [Candidatus Verstraetearchaeota archaeon]